MRHLDSKQYFDNFDEKIYNKEGIGYGLCKICIQHLYKKTNASLLLLQNIKNIAMIINEKQINKDQILRCFYCLYTNKTLLKLLLLYPKIAIIIMSKKNSLYIILLAMYLFLKSIKLILTNNMAMKDYKKLKRKHFNIIIQSKSLQIYCLMPRILQLI